MKKLFFILISLLFYLFSFSQNNNCINSIELTVNGGCETGQSTELSNSEIGEDLSCVVADQTIWYCFQAPLGIYNVYLIVDHIDFSCNPSMSIYGPFVSCISNCLPLFTNQVSCIDVLVGSNNIDTIPISVVPSQYYLIQYSDGTIGGGMCKTAYSDINSICVKTGICGQCLDICGTACVYDGASAPTVAWVTANCNSFDALEPVGGSKIFTYVEREMSWNFTANNSIMNIGMVISASCTGPGNISYLNWRVYDICSGILIDNGTLSDLIVNGLTCGINFILEMDWKVSSNCTYHALYYPYLYASASCVLPIELLYFKGKLIKNNNVYLEWITVSEINNDYFTIEKSNNAIDFEILTNIMGAGNSTQLLNYSYIDNKPYNGVNYYRLKQTDYDGKYSYSEIIAITIKKDIQNKYIYYDMYGRIVLGKWDDFPTGIYICFDGIEYEKLFKF